MQDIDKKNPRREIEDASGMQYERNETSNCVQEFRKSVSEFRKLVRESMRENSGEQKGREVTNKLRACKSWASKS